MSRGTAAATARLAVWSAFLAVALRLLHGSTLGTLSIPLGSLDELGIWADRTSPAVMALGLVRLSALAAAWYLVAATVLVVVADVAGWRGLARAVGAVSPAVVRRVATRGAGAGLAAGALLGGVPLPSPLDSRPAVEAPAGPAIPLAPLPAFGAADPPTPAVARPPSPAAPSSATATMTRLPASAEATATMTRLPDTPDRAAPTTHTPDPPADSTPAPSRTTTTPAPASPARAPGATSPRPGAGLPLVPPPGPAAPAPAPRVGGVAATAVAAPEEWVVELGDSLWTIAEETVTDARAGAAASEADVTAYWRRLVEANRDRLAAPANPDLLLPGQHLVLPAVT